MNLTFGDSVNFTLTGNLTDGTPFGGTDTIKVFSKDDKKDPETNIRGGGGGGGGASDEKYDNIERREKRDQHIYKDISTKYSFTELINPVASIDIEGNVNAGEVTVSVEVLKGTSTLVNNPAPGTVYKNINIYVGTASFSTPKNIKEAVITFRTENSWLDNNGFAGSEVRMHRWDGKKWEELETKMKSKDSAYTWFEAYTKQFSPFAISGLKNELFGSMPAELEMNEGTGTSEISALEEAPGKENVGWLSGFLGVVAVFFLIVIAILIFYRARGDDQTSS